MIEISIEDRAVRQSLQDLARRAADMTPAMHDIGQALVEGIRDRIRGGHDWEGRAFAPNSSYTLARKRGTKPLIDTGTMVGSRMHYSAGHDHVEVGVSAAQAPALHFGAKRGSLGRTKKGAPIPLGDIPPRPFMPIEGRDRLPASAGEIIRNAIADYLADAING